jgi:dipeptide/tripeptide permease
MSPAGRLLIFGGLALAGIGMLYGLYYALFVEHQTLDGMGGALTEAFVKAAERHPAESAAAIEDYSRIKYVYLRQVDVHSHWIGLAMLLIALGAAFDRARFAERTRLWIAVALLSGSFVFPLGVLLQTMFQGPLPSALAIAGSALVTGSLAISAVGFARSPE